MEDNSGLPGSKIASCGDLSCEFLVDPIPRPKPAPFEVRTKPARRRVVMLDHGKPNSANILLSAKAFLEAEGVEVEMVEKPAAGSTMPDAMLDYLSKDEGLVLCGVSDCGSCSASSAIDSITLQQRGVAGIAVLTEPFANQVNRAMAYHVSDRKLPVVMLPHPMQNIDEGTIGLRGRELADAALRLLDGLDV